MKRHSILIHAALAWLGAGATLAQPAPGADGTTLYARNCAACHQANGRGIPGAFPALAGSALVLGAAPEAAEVLLKGRGGMPDFSGSLDDVEIALVLSYARASWGNRAGPVSDAEVAARRVELQVPPASRSRFGNQH